MVCPEYLYDYDYDNETNEALVDILDCLPKEINITSKRVPLKYMYTGMYSLVLLLGVCLNGLVIVLTCRMKKTTGTIWFLGLAVTDLTFCVFLPFMIIYAMNDFNWTFGLIMCKLNSYVMFINMFSTALILTFLSVHRCFSALNADCFKKCCTALTATNMVWASWFISAILSTPSLVLRDIAQTPERVICFDNYTYGFLNLNTTEGKVRIKVVILTRFIFGLFLPFFIIGLGSSLVSLKSNYKFTSSKPYRIVRIMIFAYFLCWGPYHVFMLVALHSRFLGADVVAYGLPVVTILATCNSCINPMIYILKGKDMKMSWMEDIFVTKEPNKLEEVSTPLKSHHSGVDA
ncbi:CML1 protein, partial [Amia calva]|nr:CML1 protein [Amia calva]